MMHQVSVLLDETAFATLKQRSKATRKPYAAIIAEALALLATPASDPTSQPLVKTSGTHIYATLGLEAQTLWKKKTRELRVGGKSYSTIAKILFQEYQLTGQDGLPLNPSTVRGMCSL